MRMLLIGLLIIVMAGCGVNPVTGEKELTLMSASQEVDAGSKQYVPYQQQQGGRYVVDPEVNVYVSQVGRRLAAVSDRTGLPYEFVVLNNNTPNAWALPGGKIAINRGLLALLDDEAQLAAVLAHEVVHAAARHSARQMTQATLLQAGMMAAGIAAQSTDYGQWIATGAGLGANLWQAHYGRDQELEADEYGVLYMHRAGYDTQAAVEIQQKFLALSQSRQSDFFTDLFASHPPSAVRVDKNQVLAQKYGGGTRNQAAFAKAVAQIKKDQPAYTVYQKAVVAAQNNDFDQAQAQLAEALRLQPNEALFHITTGQLAMAQKDVAKAESEFRRAVSLNPEYYMGHLGLGMVLKERGKATEAEAAFKASMQHLATPLASYHLGELSLAKGDTRAAKSYFEFAAKATGKVGEAAKAQLAKLTPPTTTP